MKAEALTSNDCGCWVDNSAGVLDQAEFAERILGVAQTFTDSPKLAEWEKELAELSDNEDWLQFACEIQDEILDALNDAAPSSLIWEIDDNSLFLIGENAEPTEPCEDDILIVEKWNDSGVYQNGKKIIRFSGAAQDYPIEKLYDEINAHMEKDQFWPNVWRVYGQGEFLDDDFVQYNAKIRAMNAARLKTGIRPLNGLTDSETVRRLKG